MAMRKKGQTVKGETRSIARRIAQKCDEEAVKGELLHPLHAPNVRTAEYTGLSITTIIRIKNESSDSDKGLLTSSDNKRPRAEEKKFHYSEEEEKFYCSEEEKKLIRNLIYKFYIEKKVVPTYAKLLMAIREETHFPWGLTTLRKLLKDMGYKWKKCNKLEGIIIERPNIVAWRGKYLKALFHYRAENRVIIYIDEMWVDNTLCFGKCWQSAKEPEILQKSSWAHRLIIVQAGNKNGFVPNAGLIFKAGTTTGDYHGQMNATNFEKWILIQLLPNIPKNSVVVMDNAPYHSVQMNKPPSKYATKGEMISWLVQHNIPYSTDMKKYELSELIARNKSTEKIYKVDLILKAYGYIVLRLPPYMRDLNPMELAWTHLKRKMRENNSSTLTLDKLQALTHQAIDTITSIEWTNFCKHTEEIERNYAQQDDSLEDAIDRLNLNIEDTDSAESENDDNFS